MIPNQSSFLLPLVVVPGEDREELERPRTGMIDRALARHPFAFAPRLVDPYIDVNDVDLDQ